jgi:hypothetical protein
MPDFKQSPFMYALGGAVAVFVIAQSLFFMAKAFKRGREIGIPLSTLRGTITSSVLFTIAPSLAIAATVLALSNALGLILPWIRLSVIGNISYEATAATAAAEGLGLSGNLGTSIDDPRAFSAIAWVMTIGSVLPLILQPLFLKKIQTKLGKAGEKNARWMDVMSAAAFVGLIAAFVARALAGKGAPDKAGDGAGILSVITLAASIGCMLLLSLVSRRFKKFEPFAMPVSMFFAMGVAILAAQLLPAQVTFLEWRG